jgi:hypothetical protein
MFRMTRSRWTVTGLLGVLALGMIVTCGTTQMPGSSYQGLLPQLSTEEKGLAEELEGHVRHLALTIGERHLHRFDALKRTERYIQEELERKGYEVHRQPYKARGKEVANLWVEIPGVSEPGKVVVIGAHYDTVPGTPGANDNGSGVAALLALARRFAVKNKTPPAKTLRFVAFVNEEPPYFHTEEMGSLVYARRCRERREQVEAMLALETMGYFSDEPGSQQYPFPFSLFYPDRGNFIAVVGNTSSRALVRRVVRQFRERARFPSEGAAVPGFITGVGWSDHWSFWQVGYKAAMITDTAPFRFAHYHEATDTPDKLDYERLARVVEGLVHVVGDLTGR